MDIQILPVISEIIKEKKLSVSNGWAREEIASEKVEAMLVFGEISDKENEGVRPVQAIGVLALTAEYPSGDVAVFDGVEGWFTVAAYNNEIIVTHYTHPTEHYFSVKNIKDLIVLCESKS